MIQSSYSLAFNGKALLNNSKEMLWQRNIYQVTTSTDGHGTMTASPMSGFSGTNVTLSNTPNANYGFQSYSITGATLTGNQFTLNNDVTARAGFSALPPPSAVLYDDSSVFTGETLLSGNRKFTKDINQPLTGFNYYVITFDKRTNAGSSCVCIEPTNWSAKPIDGYVGVRGQVYFYPTSNVSRVVENNIPYWYNSAYSEGTWHRFKLLINKANTNYSRVYVNNTDCGYGNIPGSTTAINKITFHLIARESTFSARNFKIAGFNNFVDANRWNG